MRTRWIGLMLAVCLASCGSDPLADVEPPMVPVVASTTVASSTTSVTVAPPTTVPAVTSTSADSTTTVALHEPVWTVEDLGRTPNSSFARGGALGSGCGPGTDDLPDGVWFGWVGTTGTEAVGFDLACLWPGRIEPAASNEAARVRQVPTSPDARVYLNGAEAVPISSWDGEPTAARNAPGLPESLPFWIFVNNSVITEMAEYPGTVDWMLTKRAWPNLIPGCCDGGTVAPPSPIEPWPSAGWPADGFYATGASVSNNEINVTLSKWVRCTEHPGMCPEWWSGDEVTTDRDAPHLERHVPFDRDLTAVILPIMSDTSIVGDGRALRLLLDDFIAAIEAWIENPAITWDDLTDLSKNPDFPFGGPDNAQDNWGDLFGYRGPGGVHLTPYSYGNGLPGWVVLEVRDGRPILYIHAGIIAG